MDGRTLNFYYYMRPQENLFFNNPIIPMIFCEVLPSLVAQTVKRLPTMRETQVQSLGWEDPLEKEMATHSSTLAWKIPWTKECGRPMGLQRVGNN